MLDVFAGTGGTGVAAILTGRRAILVEKDAQWIPVIVDRVKAAERIVREMSEI